MPTLNDLLNTMPNRPNAPAPQQYNVPATPQPMPGQGGGVTLSMLQNFQQNYQDVSNAYNQMNAGGGVTRDDMFGVSQQQQQASPGFRKMNPWEFGVSKLSNMADKAVEAFGFNPEEWKDPANYAKFFASLPVQMLSAIPSGAAGLTEMVTGAPVRDADPETGMISNETLAPLKRLASGAEGAIDLIGIPMGGTGRVVGTAAEALSKTNKFGRMAGGWLPEIFESKPMKVGISVAQGAAEEAGEEATQSILDDIRYDRLDENSYKRAAQGAAWGALGGAGMAGVMSPIHMKLQERNAARGDTNQPGGRQQQITNFDADYNDLHDRPGQWRSQEVQDAYTEQMKKWRIIPGSGVVKHARSDSSLGMVYTDIGEENVIEIVKNGSEDARVVAKSLGVTDDQLMKAVMSPNEIVDDSGKRCEDTAEALNFFLSKHPKGVDIVVGRDPDTKNGAYKVRIRQFTKGQDISLPPAIYTVVGSDVDGDSSGIYFDIDRFNVNGYATEMAMDPEGKSNIDWWYSGINNHIYDSDEGAKKVDEIFESKLGMYDADRDGKKFWEHYRDRFKDALKAKQKERDKALSSVFNDMRLDINDITGDEMSGNLAFSDIVGGIAVSPENMLAKINEANGKVLENALTNAYMDTARKDDPDIDESKARAILRNGTLGDVFTHPGEFIQWIGDMYYTLVDTGNPAYRKYGMFYYKSISDGAFSGELAKMARFLDDKSVFDDLVRAEFKLAESGVSPLFNIEGLIHMFTLAKTLDVTGFGVNKRVTTQEDVDFLLETYRETLNEYVRMYNKASEQLTANGLVIPFDTIPKKGFGSVGDDGFMASFSLTFSKVPISEFVDETMLSSQVRSMTWGELVESVAKVPGTFGGVFESAGNSALQTLLNRSVGNYRSSEVAQSRRLRKDFAEVNTAGIEARMKDGQFDKRDYGVVTSLMSFFNSVIDPNVCMAGGLLDPHEAIKTKIGRMLYLGNASERESAIVGYSMHWQFKEIIDAINGKDKKAKERALWLLEDIREVSQLHAQIVWELTAADENGDPSYVDSDGKIFSPTLHVLEDTRHDFKWKETQITSTLTGYNGDVFLDSLKTVMSSIDSTGGIGDTLRKAENHLNSAKKALLDSDIRDIEELERAMNHGEVDEGQVRSFLEEYGYNAYTDLDLDIVGAQIWNALSLSNELVEKAVIDDASSWLHASLQLQWNGSTSSFLEEITSVGTGDYTIDGFVSNRKLLLAIFVDPNFTIDLFDPATGRHMTMNQKVLFESAIEGEIGKDGPTGRQMIQVLKKYPMLAGYFCEGRPQPQLVGGEASATHARKYGLMAEFNSWQSARRQGRGSKDNRVTHEIDRGVKLTSMWLWNQPGYKTYLVACAWDRVKDSSDPRQITRAISEMHQKLSRDFYIGSQLPHSIESRQSALMRTKGDFVRKTFDRTYLETWNEMQAAHIRNMETLGDDLMTSYDGIFETDMLFADMAFCANINNLVNVLTPTGSEDTSVEGLLTPEGEINVEYVETVMQQQIGRVLFDIDQLRHLTIAQSVMYAEIMGRYSDHVDFSASRVSDSQIKQAKQAIREAVDAALREDARAKGNETYSEIPPHIQQMIDDKVDSIAEMMSGRSYFVDENGEILSDVTGYVFSEEDFATEEAFTAKYLDLIQFVGDPIVEGSPVEKSTMEKIKTDYFDMVLDQSLSEEQRAKKRKAFRQLWRKKVIAHEMEQAAAFTNWQGNANVFGLESDVFDLFDSVYDDGKTGLKSFLRENGADFAGNTDAITGDFNGFTIPSGLADRTVQSIVTNLTVMDSASGNPMAVNNNGGQNKHMQGFMYLPHATPASVAPRSGVSGQEILDRLADPDDILSLRCKVMTSGEWNPDNPGAYTVSTISSIMDQIDTPEGRTALYQLFDPEDNPHGISDPHTPAPFARQARPYHRASGIIARIVDESQEGMVLKKKKKFVIAKAIVKIRSTWRDKGTSNVDPSSLTEVSTAFPEIRDKFREFRREYMREISKNFKKGGDLADLGFDDEQALIIAQMTTPGVAVTFRKPDGTVGKVLIDAKYVLSEDPSGFIDQWTRKIGDGTAMSVEPFTVPLASGSYRIMNAVTDEFRDKKDPPLGDVGKVATNAMDDWSDFEFDSMDVEDVMYRVPPVGGAYNSPLVLTNARSPYQQLLDLEYPGRMASMSMYAHKPSTTDWINTNSDHYQQAVKASEILDLDPDSELVVKTFGADRAFSSKNGPAGKSKTAFKMGLDSDQIPILRGFGKYPDNVHTDKSVGIVFGNGESDVEAAISWAMRTNNRLLIPMSVYNTTNTRASRYTAINTFSIKGIDYALIKPIDPSLRMYNPTEMPTSSTTYHNPDDDSIIVVDDFNLYNLADANIAFSESARRFRLPVDECPHYECESLLRSASGEGYSLVSGKKAQELYEALTIDRGGNKVMTTDPDVWRTLGFDFVWAQNKTSGLGKSSEQVMQDVYDYLRDAKEGKMTESGVVRKDSIASGSVVALLGNDSDGPTKIAPIYTPKNAPRKIDYLNVYILDGNVYVAYDGFVGLSDDFGRPRAKLGAGGVSCKGIVTPFDYAPGPPQVAVIGQDAGGREVEWIVNGDTIQSRATGRDPITLKDNLAHYLLDTGRSVFFETDADGNVMTEDLIDDEGNVILDEDGSPRKGPKWKARFTKKENFAKIGLETEGEIRGFLIGLVNGDWNSWKYVASGDFNIFDGKYANANMYMRNIAMNNRLGYKVSLPQMLSAHLLGSDGKVFEHGTIEDYHMALEHLDFNQTLEFFHAIDQSICPNGAYDESWDPDAGLTAFDTQGRMRFYIPLEGNKHTVRYLRFYWNRHDFTGDYSESSIPTGERSFGWQHVYRRGADNGVIDRDLEHAILYSDMLLRNNEHMRVRSMLDWARDPKENIRQRMANDPVIEMLRDQPASTFREREHEKNVISVEETFRHTRKIKSGDEFLVDPMKDARVSAAVERFREYIPDISFNFVMQLLCNQDGYTYIHDTGLDWIDVNALIRNIDAMCDSIKKRGLVITVAEGGYNSDLRYQVPLLDPYRADIVWEHSPYIRNIHNGIKQNFIDAMKEENKNAVEAVQKIDQSNLSKKRALELFLEWSCRQYGEPYPTGYLYSGVYLDELMRNATELGSMLMKGERGWTQEQRDMYDECVAHCQKQMQNARKQLDKSRGKVTARYMTSKGEIISEMSKKDDGILVSKILNNMTELSKVMALLNPGVMLGNLIDRAIHQGIMNVSLKLGHEFHIGPYSSKRWLNQDIVERAVNDPLFMRLYVAYRQAGFSGQELEFLAQAQNAEDILAWLDEREKNMTPYQKAVSRIYDISSGGNKLLKQQMRNFINRFAMFAESSGQDFWFTEADGVTYLEARLAGDKGAGRWFVDILGGNHAMTPSLDIALRAMNSAKAGDMAQRHVITEFYSQVARRSPLSKFFMTTTISRFPNYSINVTERMLNWILPMSSIRYVMTEKLAERHPEMNLENTQIHTGLREALLVDITHLGVGAVAMILVGMSGALQPPEDDDKWGNTDEWTLFGYRVGEAWWIQDILGIALPLACFTKAAQMGNPRIDILSNGIAQACYNNPIIKVSDAVGFFLEPEGSFVSDYNQDVINYAKAEGGPPGWMDWLQANATSFGLSWVSQFITPSVVREWYTNAQDYEASYKKIYKESATGRINAEGLEGETQYTTYQDAMIRRTTRRNPVLGWLLDLVLQPETGYMWHEMPDTIYYDDAQIASQERWSVEGLSDAETRAKLFEIIENMQRYKNMDDLIKTGFYLDPETKAALSQQVWDNYHEIDEWWYGLQADGQLDYYALGNGDFTTGSKVFAELKQEYQKAKEYWSDFYYDKVRNLPSTMTMYRRYNTTYKKDVNGNYYATGFRPTGVLPISSAPGQLDNPEGTAGRENDWATISAVTGQPMQQRALVPVKSEYEDWPDLESWSGDGNGNGYSKMYQKHWGQGTTYSDASGSGSSSGGSRRRSGGYRRSGGGGGSRRSYSYGGSGSPNITNPFGYSQNISTPREMDRVNLQRAYLDYLRPGFETKGSREAYKREDI